MNLLQHFLNFEENAQKHYLYSLKYSTLYNNISRMLALENLERNEVNEYFKWVAAEYDNLYNNMPNLSHKAIKKYEKKFDTKFENKQKIDIETPVPIKLSETKQTNKTELTYALERYAMHCYPRN